MRVNQKSYWLGCKTKTFTLKGPKKLHRAECIYRVVIGKSGSLVTILCVFITTSEYLGNKKILHGGKTLLK